MQIPFIPLKNIIIAERGNFYYLIISKEAPTSISLDVQFVRFSIIILIPKIFRIYSTYQHFYCLRGHFFILILAEQ